MARLRNVSQRVEPGWRKHGSDFDVKIFFFWDNKYNSSNNNKSPYSTTGKIQSTIGSFSRPPLFLTRSLSAAHKVKFHLLLLPASRSVFDPTLPRLSSTYNSNGKTVLVMNFELKVFDSISGMTMLDLDDDLKGQMSQVSYEMSKSLEFVVAVTVSKCSRHPRLTHGIVIMLHQSRSVFFKFFFAPVYCS